MLGLGAIGFILALVLLYTLGRLRVFLELNLTLEPGNSDLWVGLRVGRWLVWRQHWRLQDVTWQELLLVARQLRDMTRALEEKTIRATTLRLPGLLRTLLRWARWAPIPAEYLLRRMSCQRLDWTTRVGTGNPALTGFTVGCLWALKHQLLRTLARGIDKMTAIPRIAITPDFTGTSFALALHCIFALRVGHIISAMGSTGWLMFCSFVRGERIEQPSH